MSPDNRPHVCAHLHRSNHTLSIRRIWAQAEREGGKKSLLHPQMSVKQSKSGNPTLDLCRLLLLLLSWLPVYCHVTSTVKPASTERQWFIETKWFGLSGGAAGQTMAALCGSSAFGVSDSASNWDGQIQNGGERRGRSEWVKRAPLVFDTGWTGRAGSLGFSLGKVFGQTVLSRSTVSRGMSALWSISAFWHEQNLCPV